MSKNSKVGRIIPELEKLMNEAKADVARAVMVDPREVRTPLAQNKVVQWAKVGRAIEFRNKCKNKKSFGSKVENFLDEFTGI